MSFIVVKDYHAEFPLIITGNQDSTTNHISSPVEILSKKPLIMGVKEDNNVWFGVNERSIYISYSNQQKLAKKRSNISSIILELLKSASIKELLFKIENICIDDFNDFNLIFGDSKNSYIGYSYLFPSRVIVKELHKGIHTITSKMIPNDPSNQSALAHSTLGSKSKEPWLDYYSRLKKVVNSVDYGFKKRGKNGILTLNSVILAFSNDGLERFKFYDRLAKRLDGDKRYSDHIDIFRDNIRR